MTVAAPEADLGILPKADGSATFKYAGYTITASVNGPIEAARRDEHPYKAHVDVIVRPAAGTGGTRERHLESLLESSLSQIILVKDFPRCLIQIVLQIETAPANDYVNTKLVQAGINLPIIPALMQTAVLALLSACVPMATTAAAAVTAFVSEGNETRLVVDPPQRELETANSAHVFAFTARGQLLLAESQGDFTMAEWEEAHATAKKICSEAAKKEGMEMVLDDEKHVGPDLQRFLRSTMESKVAEDLLWR
ncbi:hypothetical protein CONLIGDRAFT_46602 [Coniochaeta ligniaria NRRL 30616]|uniref:Exoribonuclease phosphorolytic domain-containing protein n=1 Tax=Coniochaeta ligniaria NRRL 30616 TaxID=1408157 RepID=A0A1J7J6X6_9PEZI|nr:hypothetical protein CONLIGDRAFT_46602 [Coniochaeta ligniaria NRRL 30616]